MSLWWVRLVDQHALLIRSNIKIKSFAVEKVVTQNLPHRKVAKREISLIET